MRHGGVDGDDQIERVDGRRGIGEVVDDIVEAGDRQRRQTGQVGVAVFALEADEGRARQRDERGQARQRNAAVVVVLVAGLAGPGEADAQTFARHAGEDMRAGRREQVWHLDRHRLDGGAEGARQAHQRAMHIERRQRRAAVEHDHILAMRPEQRHQAVGQFQHDARAACFDQRQIAQHLDAVAVALLGMQQDGLASDIFAAPLRLCETARGQLGGAAPAPFIALKAVRIIAERELQQSLVPVCLRHLGLERDRLVEARHRLAGAAEIAQRAAAVDQRRGERLARDRRVVIG